MRVFVLVSVFVGVFGSVAAADPSLLGPTGLLNVPTAETLNSRDYNFFANHWGGPNSLNRYGGNFGMGSTRGVEIGATIHDPETGEARTVLNAKFQLQAGTSKGTVIAAGIIDAFQEIDNNRTGYLSITKEMGQSTTSRLGLRRPTNYITVGIGSRRGGEVLDGLFAGISFGIDEDFRLLVEHDAEDLNLGLRFAPDPRFRIDFGQVNGETTFGVSYLVMGAKKETPTY